MTMAAAHEVNAAAMPPQINLWRDDLVAGAMAPAMQSGFGGGGECRKGY